MTSSSLQSAVDAIHRAFSDILVPDDHQYAWENARRFAGYAKRLQLLVNQLHRSSAPENLAPPVQTALKGISADLTRVAESLSVYKKKSKIFVLIKCRELSASLQERALAIGGWLALLHSAVHDDDLADFQKKISDLSGDMKQAHFRVMPLFLSIFLITISCLVSPSISCLCISVPFSFGVVMTDVGFWIVICR